MKDKMEKWVENARTAIKWVAVDWDGTIWGYGDEPICGEEGWEVISAIFLGETRDKELIKNWKDTLTEVDYGD